jgi:hypothetical protein
MRRVFAATVLSIAALSSPGRSVAAPLATTPPALIATVTADGDVLLIDSIGMEVSRFQSVITPTGWGRQILGLFGSRLVLNDHAVADVVVIDISTGAVDRIHLDVAFAAVPVPGSAEMLIAADYYGSDEALLIDLRDLTEFDVAEAAGAGTEAYFSYTPDGVERSRVTIPWSRAFAELPDGGVVAVDDSGGVHRIDPDVTSATMIGAVSMRSGDLPSISAALDGEAVVVGYDVAVDLQSGHLVEVSKGTVSAASFDGCTLVVRHSADAGTSIFRNGIVTSLAESAEVLAMSADGASVIVADERETRLAPTDSPAAGIVLRTDGIDFTFL